MKYKLLVLDVDGTLVNNQKEITPRTLSTLLKVQQMGVHIVLASGRPTNGVVPLANKLELNRYGGFILSYNGGQIINAQTGELLFEKRIAPEWIPYFEKKARKNGFALFTYHKDFILTTNPDNPHVVVETVKPSENGEGIIVRMYEDSGASTTAKLSVSFPYRSVVETDLIETELGAIDDLTLTFKPFEIRTFLFR